jgi:hypothetical protein
MRKFGSCQQLGWSIADGLCERDVVQGGRTRRDGTSGSSSDCGDERGCGESNDRNDGLGHDRNSSEGMRVWISEMPGKAEARWYVIVCWWK